jgi:hypothetical protein
MQVGTEILLARMKEYPEEFMKVSYDSRWTRIIEDAKEYLPKEDVEALDEGFRQVKVDQFNERVLARLAGEGEQEVEETMTIKASGRYAIPQAINQISPQAYEQMVKQKQYETDQKIRAMQAQNNAMQNQYASGLQSGANGLSISDWLTGGSK